MGLGLGITLAAVVTLGVTLGLTLAAFCALQDIGPKMGASIFLPRTHTPQAHADFYTYENFDLAFRLGLGLGLGLGL